MATASFGTLFQRFLSGSPGSWETVTKLTNIDGLGIESSPIDATHSESADAFQQFIPGINKAKNFTLTHHYVPAIASPETTVQHKVRADIEGRVQSDYRIVFPSGQTITFNSAIVTDFQITPGDVAHDGKFTLTITLQPSGKPAWSNTTAS